MNKKALFQLSFIGSKERPPMKKEQPQNARGSKERPPMKKGNPKMQGAQKKDL
jgi:hypothetical protein